MNKLPACRGMELACPWWFINNPGAGPGPLRLSLFEKEGLGFRGLGFRV